MARRAAEVEALDRRPILARAAERTVVSDLSVGEGTDQEIAAAHVRQLALGIERATREPADGVVGEIGRVLRPELEHLPGMRVAHAIPVPAAQTVGQLLPHEGRVPARGRLRWIEERWARAPHHRRWNAALLVAAHDLVELLVALEAENHHERLLERSITRRRLEHEVQCEKRREQVVFKLARVLLQLARALEQIAEGWLRI